MRSKPVGSRSRRFGVVLLALGLGGVFLFSGYTRADDAPAKEQAKRESIYDAKADAKEQVAKATARAKENGKRVLLMFGGDWCGWCHKLHALFQGDREVRSLLTNEYELVMIDTDAPHAMGFLEETSKGLGDVGYPFLAVLDADGKVLVGQKTGALEEGNHHDPEKVKAFLDKWKAEPRDAEALLRDTLSRAATEDKRVFLTFGADWCGWCHRLEDFLALPEVAKLIDHDFIIVKVDIERMKNGKDVMNRYRTDDSGGIPWYAILDAKGEKHGTADAAFGNIGYPFEPNEIDAFVALIESQGKLKSEQVAELRKELEKAAERIKAKRGTVKALAPAG